MNGESADARPEGSLTAPGRAWIRRTVLAVIEEYCNRHGKRLYCDKSLDSGHHLALVRDLFPELRAVLVFRHVMDTIASGIEASPWGFSAYGYGPYTQAWPGNSVAALANYWLDHVDRALRWEKEHPDACHRVRYEDLVLAPEATMTGIQEFLGVRTDLSVLSRAFSREPARGPGDYKVEHTTAVHGASIGKGKRVPISMLPPPLLDAVQEKLQRLGYDRLDRGWSAAERDVDGGGHGVWAARLANLMSDLEFREGEVVVGPFAVVAEDHRSLRWVVEPELGAVARGDGEVEAVLTGTAEDLVLMLTGEENLGVLLRSGRVRHVVAEDDDEARDLFREVTVLVALLRGGVRDELVA